MESYEASIPVCPSALAVVVEHLVGTGLLLGETGHDEKAVEKELARALADDKHHMSLRLPSLGLVA